MKFLWVIKLLDMIHDVLCPFFRDREVEGILAEKKELKEENKEKPKTKKKKNKRGSK